MLCIKVPASLPSACLPEATRAFIAWGLVFFREPGAPLPRDHRLSGEQRSVFPGCPSSRASRSSREVFTCVHGPRRNGVQDGQTYIDHSDQHSKPVPPGWSTLSIAKRLRICRWSLCCGLRGSERSRGGGARAGALRRAGNLHSIKCCVYTTPSPPTVVSATRACPGRRIRIRDNSRTTTPRRVIDEGYSSQREVAHHTLRVALSVVVAARARADTPRRRPKRCDFRGCSACGREEFRHMDSMSAALYLERGRLARS